MTGSRVFDIRGSSPSSTWWFLAIIPLLGIDGVYIPPPPQKLFILEARITGLFEKVENTNAVVDTTACTANHHWGDTNALRRAEAK